MGGILSKPPQDSYQFGVDEEEATEQASKQKAAPKKRKKKSTDGGNSKVKTELHDNKRQPGSRGNGKGGRSSREIAVRRRSDEESKKRGKCIEDKGEKGGKGGKFSKQQQRKIRAIIKFGKGVKEETVESKFAWIAREQGIQAPLSQNDVVLSRTLGQGISGIVRLAKLRGGKYCACKCVQKNRVARAKDAKRVHTERQALTECRSPFVVQLLGTYQDRECVYFLLEYAAGGELFERLRKADKLSNDVAKFYGAEVLVAVDHVHKMGYMYRDLKPENVLLDEMGHIKLTDFGFAKLPEDNGRCYTRLGTPQYLSPEMLEIKCKEGYTMAVDWWAWACMIFEFLTARTPFWRDHRDTRHEIYLRALRGKANWNSISGMPKVVKGLLKQMLKPNINKRLHSVEDIKKHAWFTGVDWKAVNSKKMRVPFEPQISGTGDTGNFKHDDEAADSDSNSSKPRRTDPIDQSLFAGF